MADSVHGGTDDAQLPPELCDMPEEVLELLCVELTEDYCAGVTSLVWLSQTSRQFHTIAVRPASVARCAAHYGNDLARLNSSQLTLELLGVMETVAALGTTRIYFQRKGRAYVHDDKPKIRPGSSVPRLDEFALLLRKHPRLMVSIDGHESTAEGVVHQTENGIDIRASYGCSLQRALAVRDALVDLECLEKITGPNHLRVWGRLPPVRFEKRITCVAGWEDAVTVAAGWTGHESAHAELFFKLDGVEVPSRGAHYQAAVEEMERKVGWQHYFGEGTET